ncbi:DUF2721 domain-containing protein [candidate division WOR-3 bacterium]|nr:DUF2721 domain-containing protein [candidate division WOR-3 bacterium]
MTLDPRIFNVIQAMLSPAVMISCSALLLLSLVPRLSRVIDRIRLLNQEKTIIAKKPSREDIDQERIDSIEHQCGMLVYRAKLLKRSSGATLLAIFLFVITSVLIGMSFALKINIVTLTLGAFLVGMVIVLVGVGFAYWEIRISHNTIREEIEVSQAIADRLLKKSR